MSTEKPALLHPHCGHPASSLTPYPTSYGSALNPDPIYIFTSEPWCAQCIADIPEDVRAATEFLGKVKLGGWRDEKVEKPNRGIVGREAREDLKLRLMWQVGKSEGRW